MSTRRRAFGLEIRLIRHSRNPRLTLELPPRICKCLPDDNELSHSCARDQHLSTNRAAHALSVHLEQRNEQWLPRCRFLPRPSTSSASAMPRTSPLTFFVRRAQPVAPHVFVAMLTAVQNRLRERQRQHLFPRRRCLGLPAQAAPRHSRSRVRSRSRCLSATPGHPAADSSDRRRRLWEKTDQVFALPLTAAETAARIPTRTTHIASNLENIWRWCSRQARRQSRSTRKRTCSGAAKPASSWRGRPPAVPSLTTSRRATLTPVPQAPLRHDCLVCGETCQEAAARRAGRLPSRTKVRLEWCRQ